MTIHVSIGNSDDKLAQDEWAAYCNRVDGIVRAYSTRVFGAWYSLSNSPWQNACWAVEVSGDNWNRLRAALTGAASFYRQDSIAWCEGETEFLEPPS